MKKERNFILKRKPKHIFFVSSLYISGTTYVSVQDTLCLYKRFWFHRLSKYGIKLSPIIITYQNNLNDFHKKWNKKYFEELLKTVCRFNHKINCTISPQSDEWWPGVFADIALFRPAQATSLVMFRTGSDAAGQQCRSEARWILYDGWQSWADYIAVLIKAALQSTWLGVDLEYAAVFKEKLLYASKRTMFLWRQCLTSAALRAIFAPYNFFCAKDSS